MKNNKFYTSKETSSPTSSSEASLLQPTGDSIMYIETSANNQGEEVFVSSERTDIIQITNITLHFKRYSILTNDCLKQMGRFRVQLFLEDNTWSTRYNITKNNRYSNTSTFCTLVSSNFTIESCGLKSIYDQIDTPHVDMCFSIITKTSSVC